MIMEKSFNSTKSTYTKILYGIKGGVTESINNIFNLYPEEDFYHITNDDVIYESPLWDIELAIKGKISWGKDGIQNEGLVTFPMIDGDIVRALGWLQLPSLNRYCGDVVWKFIGKECGILNYCPNVKITHKWEGCTDAAMNYKDMAAFAEWLPVSYSDINKVKNAIINTK